MLQNDINSHADLLWICVEKQNNKITTIDYANTAVALFHAEADCVCVLPFYHNIIKETVPPWILLSLQIAHDTCTINSSKTEVLDTT